MIARPQRIVVAVAGCALLLSLPALEAQELAAEIWVAPSSQLAVAEVGDWGTTAAGSTHFSFAVPADLDAAVAPTVTVLVIGKRTTDATAAVSVSIGADGDGQADVSNAVTGLPVNLVKNVLTEVDVSGVFAFTADPATFPGDLMRGVDYVGMHFSVAPNGQARVVGLRFQYQKVPELGGLECADNQVVAGFAADGSLICRTACEAGEVFVGWDSAGDPICLDDNQRCDDGEVMVGFDLSGSPICRPDCASGQVRVGSACVAADQACPNVCVGGSNPGAVCTDDAECGTDGTCTGQQIMLGFDLAGSPTCIPGIVECPVEEVGQCADGPKVGDECTAEGGECGEGFDCVITRFQTTLIGFNLATGEPRCVGPGGVGDDGEVGEPTLEIDDVTGSEGDGTFTFTVTLNDPPVTGNVTVQVDTADGTATAGSDYTSVSALGLTLSAASPTAAVNVTILDDAIGEPTEVFFVRLSNASGATILDDEGVGTIQDDDAQTACITGTVSSLLFGPRVGVNVFVRDLAQSTFGPATTNASGVYCIQGLNFPDTFVASSPGCLVASGVQTTQAGTCASPSSCATGNILCLP